jgi:hypothetical protein
MIRMAAEQDKVMKAAVKLKRHLATKIFYIEDVLQNIITEQMKFKMNSSTNQNKTKKIQEQWTKDQDVLGKIHAYYDELYTILYEPSDIHTSVNNRVHRLMGELPYMDDKLQKLGHTYRNTVPALMVRPYTPRSRSISPDKLPPVDLTKIPNKSILKKRNTVPVPHIPRPRNRSRSPDDPTRKSTNRNRNQNRRRTIRISNAKAEQFGIEGRDTGEEHPFELRIDMTLTPEELNSIKKSGYNSIRRMYGNTETYRNKLSGWAANPSIQRNTDAFATSAKEAADAAHAAAHEARDIDYSSISADAAKKVKASAAHAADAALYAEDVADTAASSFSITLARTARDAAISARDAAIAARDAARAAAASNRQNST